MEDLRRCLASIREKSTYANYEILVIENNSVEAETEAYYQRLLREHPDGRLRILRYPGSFNYAAIHNFAVPQAGGEYLILLNNDTEVRSEGWIEELLGLCQQDGVGAVGAKLYYPDGTIQHAGVVLGLCGVASHLLSVRTGREMAMQGGSYPYRTTVP
ncbi:MAG: glycosyltransferase [Lachnospiraceae bacterium]